MWIKFGDELYNMDDMRNVNLYGCDDRWGIQFQDRQGEFHEEPVMTYTKAHFMFNAICEGLKNRLHYADVTYPETDGCTVLDLDRRLPVETKRIQETDEADGDSYKRGC